jgi:hypothetical protein
MMQHSGNDMDRTLAKMDVDAKRAGRVGLNDFTTILKQMEELRKFCGLLNSVHEGFG